ncbi:hypothetical protein CH380_02225 [Leptospira adleri]|uniref:Uncharacterized protein n=1 Tax=Leptospira adleri TaxID=2023186 RepID=A0A2M9YSQ2_9LEPT|nr:hypothetical protein CH380_02225 [Leptospira adleri]PJZ59774.1 hypothetical protein CH376_21905 [Leptospira adleri]
MEEERWWEKIEEFFYIIKTESLEVETSNVGTLTKILIGISLILNLNRFFRLAVRGETCAVDVGITTKTQRIGPAIPGGRSHLRKSRWSYDIDFS